MWEWEAISLRLTDRFLSSTPSNSAFVSSPTCQIKQERSESADVIHEVLLFGSPGTWSYRGGFSSRTVKWWWNLESSIRTQKSRVWKPWRMFYGSGSAWLQQLLCKILKGRTSPTKIVSVLFPELKNQPSDGGSRGFSCDWSAQREKWHNNQIVTKSLL